MGQRPNLVSPGVFARLCAPKFTCRWRAHRVPLLLFGLPFFSKEGGSVPATSNLTSLRVPEALWKNVRLRFSRRSDHDEHSEDWREVP